MLLRSSPDRKKGAGRPRATPQATEAARDRLRNGRVVAAVAPHVRRAGDRLRRVPAIAGALDRVAGVWATLVEAFCQAIEPVLALRFPEQRLVAVVDEAGAPVLHRVGPGGVATLGALDALGADTLAGLAAARWSAVELRLPPAQILERRLTLPAASRAFLAPILEHRLERLTPWRPERVLYGFRVEEEGQAPAGSVAVALTATSRDFVAAPLARLGSAGLVPTAIGAAGVKPDEALPVNLLGGGSAVPPPAESRRFVSRVALGIAGALLVAWIGTAVFAVAATSEGEAAAARLGKARRMLRAATLGTGDSREQALLEAKQPARATVVLVNTLAESIPADTYLKDLTVAPDKVRLVGSSGNAPALIGRLEAAGLKNVRFTSTIARDRAGRDDFELSADRPGPKSAELP